MTKSKCKRGQVFDKVSAKCRPSCKSGQKVNKSRTGCTSKKKSTTRIQRTNKMNHPAIKKLGREPRSWKALLRRPIDVSEYGLRGDKPLYKFFYWTLVKEYEMPKNLKFRVDLMEKIMARGMNKKVHLNSSGMSAGKVSNKWWDKMFDVVGSG